VKLSSRASRRLAAGIALACSAILLPAAALAATAASGSPTHRAAATVPRCHGLLAGRGTEVWLGLPGSGAAGAVYYELEFSNVGLETCTLRGFPRAVAVNRDGRQVGQPAAHAPQAPPLVTLRPGATAHVVLSVEDAGALCPGSDQQVTGTLRVHPPGQALGQEVELSVTVCRHRPSMGVLPVRPGTGIPEYTHR
jgi:Protein of unknown function (DUF4232)